MNEKQQVTARPFIIWENAKADGGMESTVQELHTGGLPNSDMPVIRIVSSGFGKLPSPVSSTIPTSQLRCAA